MDKSLSLLNLDNNAENAQPANIASSDDLRQQPSDITAKEIINPQVKSTIIYKGFARDTDIVSEPALLYLTNYRSFQQKLDYSLKKYIKETKLEMRGKLFQIRSVPPRFCGAYKSAKMRVTGNQLLEVIFSKIPCNSWTCPVCCIRKAIRLKYWLRQIIELNNLDRFITFTLDPKKIPMEYQNNTHKYITKLFNHFLTVLRRKKYSYWMESQQKMFYFDLSKANEKLKYVWVIEFQKKTHNAHMHILTNQWLPAVVIRKIWEDVGGGTQMKLEPVRSIKGISNYITDYLVKGIKDTPENVSEGSGFKYFERRYSVSKSCIKPEKKLNELFKYLPNEFKEKELIKQNLGWIVKELYNQDTNYFKVKFDNSSAPKNI